MTTIVFYKDVLYTDSRHVLTKKGHVPSLVEDQPQGKVYCHSTDGKPTVYIASVDLSPNLIQRQIIQSCVMKGSLDDKMGLLSYAHIVAAKKGETTTYGSTFVVTADNVFRVFRSSATKPENDIKTPRVVELCDDMAWPISYGTGMYLASGYLIGGGDPSRLMEFVSRHDDLTSPHTFAYHRKYLQPFPVDEIETLQKTLAKDNK